MLTAVVIVVVDEFEFDVYTDVGVGDGDDGDDLMNWRDIAECCCHPSMNPKLNLKVVALIVILTATLIEALHINPSSPTLTPKQQTPGWLQAARRKSPQRSGLGNGDTGA